MKHSSYQTFARLLESVITEASTAMDLVRNNPGGREIVQYLHKNSALGHDADWEIVKKVPWTELKGSYRGSGGGWIILIGQNGTGAIKASGGDYTISASNGKPPGADPDTGRDTNRLFGRSTSSGGRAVDMIKDIIGPIRSYSMAKSKGEVANKRNKRAALRKTAVRLGGEVISSEDATAASEGMLMRFKPLWVKMVTQAMADIKGFVGLQVKNHAFNKVQNKIERLKMLDTVLDSLQSGTDDDDGDGPNVHDYLKRSIYNAVDLSARHYYPDNMTDRQFGGRGSYGSMPEGVRLLLNDIAGGDTKKLGTVLGFFKRALLTT